MRNRRLILFAALATAWLLFACDTGVTPTAPPGSTTVPPGPTTGELLGERSQVFYSDDGGAQQSVQPNQSVTVGNGDEAWTEQQGRALLKFSDLWLRLYDDTTLRATDATPSSVKMALGQGAALTSAVPGVYDRIEITTGDPPHARIILAGTVVMVAYVPDRRITLARSFDGVLRVESAQTNARVEVQPEMWAIVWGGNEVEQTTDLNMIRELVQRIGLWDLFHTIEVDAGGFGPAGGRVPAARVQQVFVADAAAECPAPEVGAELAVTGGNLLSVAGRAVGGCPEVGIVGVTFDWGDGSGDKLSLDGGQEQSFQYRHQYAQTGSYQVVVTAHDTRDRSAVWQHAAVIEGTGATSPALPNLRGRIVSAPEKATCGENLGDAVQVEVTNTGQADVGQFSVGVYFSEDQQVTTADQLLVGGREFVDGLAAGQSIMVPMTGRNQIPTTVSEGTRDYWLAAIADDLGQINESDEGDNAGAWRISIGCLK